MLITDLLEALQKHGEEYIEFHLFINHNGDIKLLDLAITDGIYLYKIKNADGTWKNAIALGLCNKEQIEALDATSK